MYAYTHTPGALASSPGSPSPHTNFLHVTFESAEGEPGIFSHVKVDMFLR